VWWRSIKPSRATVEAVRGAGQDLSRMIIGMFVGVRLMKIKLFMLVEVIFPYTEHIDGFEMLQTLFFV
jgi:hypothetical protein